MFQTSRISVSLPPELWALVSIRLSLGSLAASLVGYILASFIRCRRRSQRVKQIRSRSTVIRYTHLYMCTYTRRFILSVCSENAHVAPRGSAGPFVCSFLSFSSPTTDDARKTPKYALPSRLGASRPRDTANVTFTTRSTIAASSPSPDRANKGISANERNTSEDEERQRSD